MELDNESESDGDTNRTENNDNEYEEIEGDDVDNSVEDVNDSDSSTSSDEEDRQHVENELHDFACEENICSSDFSTNFQQYSYAQLPKDKFVGLGNDILHIGSPYKVKDVVIGLFLLR